MRLQRVPILLAGIAVALIFTPPARLDAAITATLQPSPAGPAPVGTVVRWTAASTGGSGALWYRFRVRAPGGDFHMVRDFGPVATLDWSALGEGSYDLELTVRDLSSQEVQTVTSSFQLVSRVADQPAAAATANPLIFLFSSPGCDAGRARVTFVPTAGGTTHFTPYQPCVSGESLNFYLAGLLGNTEYSATVLVDEGRGGTAGPAVTFTTGNPAYDVSRLTVLPSSIFAAPEEILLQAPLFLPPFATDLGGNLVWYGPGVLGMTMTRPDSGGTFFACVESRTDPAQDYLRKFDLTGTTILETNAARVSEQLVAMGKRPITGFHHEARTISGGRILTMAGVEQLLTDVQGPGTVDVLGDMIIVLDPDLQVVWAWDAFDHLDVHRQASLSEHCLTNPGCPPYYLAADANDWTHGNAVSETPDGSILYSVRHQDWVVKIDYGRGTGNGDILWRLGKEGDFDIGSADPSLWFTHQHDVNWEPDSTRIHLFDNGNVRAVTDPNAHSRGQVLEIEEGARVARLVLNADLGVMSIALGSAQRLQSGDYHFNAGFIFDPTSLGSGRAYSFEVAPETNSSQGAIVGGFQLTAPVYRSFRITDMYGPAASEPERGTPRVVPIR
jgi:hypothetical protein